MSLITSIWERQDGEFFYICTKDGSGRFHEEVFKRSRIKDTDQYIRDHSHCDIYFCPQGFNEKRRKKECAAGSNILWADLDEVDPRKITLKPTIAIESSPGRFVGFWYVDRPVEETLNRRLTYKLGADKGGWDFTQVLRVPGTTNYKYSATPRVKLLWDDGPTYKHSEIVKTLGNGTLGDPTAKQIFEKYRSKVPYWVRNELFKGRPQVGKRSSMLWKLENALKKAGAGRDETLAMIKDSPWNKFKGRSSELEQLEREMDKIYDGTGEEDEVAETPRAKMLTRSMDDVEEANTAWLWYPYLARREVSVIEGDPGVGKSYLAEMVAKALVDGETLPSVKPRRITPGKVAYFDIENNASTVTKKRLKYNGCKNMQNFFQEEEPFSIEDEDAMKELYEALERVRPTAVFFDTMNHYLGRVDTAKSVEATRAMDKFKEIASRFNCSVIVLRHLTKGNTKDRAIYRGQGNIAVVGVSRILITIGYHPEDPDLLAMSMTKENLAKRPPALIFSIDELPDTLKEQDRSKFKWHGFQEGITSDDILKVTHERIDKKKVEEFLKEELNDGAVKTRDLEQRAAGRAIDMRVLERVADKLGITKTVKGFGAEKSTWWSL